MPATVVTLESAALPDDAVVVRAEGVEAMNELPRWDVTLMTRDPDVDFDAAVGTRCTLHLHDGEEGSTRALDLVIVAVAYDGESRAGHRYEVALSAPAWPLTLRSGFQIFTDKTSQEIVAEVLSSAGVADDRVVWRLASSYSRRAQCVQYGETDWSFVERLLADEGIAYWFDALEEAGPVLVLADRADAHDGIVPPEVFPFVDASGMVRPRSFFELEVTEELVPDAVHLRDTDVRHPDVPLDGRAGTGPLEHFAYPARVPTEEAAEARARVRLEQLRRTQTVASAHGDCIRVQPGRVLRVEGLADAWMNGAWLVVAVEHQVGALGSHGDGGADGLAYRNRVKMVPADRAWRPALVARAPRISEIAMAITTGPRGEEIHVDDLGRTKLRFLWDRSGITDDRSSAWTPCLQLAMGSAMALPRVGWEVPVAFFDGDPDRPLVLGRVYNATAVLPYALPAAAATTSLQSATSPGDGTTNEIRMDDSAGREELFVHASRDLSVSVGGSATTKIGADETHDVGLSYAMSIAGSQTHAVGGAQTTNVASDFTTSIKGARAESIGGSEDVGVTANRVVSAAGAYTELVGGSYTLRCNQSNTQVDGAFVQTIGGALGVIAGIGASESVAAARTEIVGGMRSILASKFHESVTGAKSTTAGTTRVAAGAKHVTSVKGAGTVAVGGSASMTAGGDVILDAPEISITVGGSLTAGALALAGGALKATKGTTKLKGPITRRGGGSIE